MDAPDATDLIERVRSLPAARPLLARVDAEPGVYLVGGAVRDLLLGGAPTDLDLLVAGDPAVVAKRLGGAVREHDRFGTATVLLEGFEYDIARARTETYSKPGALPDVSPATLAEDLLRRDFTVNALAIALGGTHPGELIAVPGALADLDARLLRALHDRSFSDDPTRLLRLIRYRARLGFEVESHTDELARAAVEDQALQTVSGPRTGAELRLLARERDPVMALELLGEYGLDEAIAPGFRIEDGALAHLALELLGDDGRRDRLALAAAARRVPGETLATTLDALGFESADRDAILAAATRAERTAAELGRATRPSEIAAAVAGAAPELVALAGALGPMEQAREWLERLRHVRLEIDGDDLLAAGVTEGPTIGAGLRAALAAKLDGTVAGREQELTEALRAAR